MSIHLLLYSDAEQDKSADTMEIEMLDDVEPIVSQEIRELIEAGEPAVVESARFVRVERFISIDRLIRRGRSILAALPASASPLSVSVPPLSPLSPISTLSPLSPLSPLGTEGEAGGSQSRAQPKASE
jgi:hypothetical protein